MTTPELDIEIERCAVPALKLDDGLMRPRFGAKKLWPSCVARLSARSPAECIALVAELLDD